MQSSTSSTTPKPNANGGKRNKRPNGRPKPDVAYTAVVIPPTQQEIDASSEDEEACLMCCEPISHFAVGVCNHRVMCGLCSLRFRELYKDKRCPLCKTELEKLVITRDSKTPFSSLPFPALSFDKRLRVHYDDGEYLQALAKLWALTCPICEAKKSPDKGSAPQIWSSLELLKQHLEKAHSLFYCDLCLQHHKIFLQEQTLYTRNQLREHTLYGTEPPNAISNAWKQQQQRPTTEKDKDKDQPNFHPMCLFCKLHFYGDEQLYEHLERTHFTCHFCERDGIRWQYFADYPHLEEHFDSDHFLCKNPQCLEQKFVAFRTDLDLQAHHVAFHLNDLSRSAERRARSIPLQLNYDRTTPSQPSSGRGRRAFVRMPRYMQQPSVSLAPAPSSAPGPSFSSQPDPPVVQMSSQEFAQRNKDFIAKLRSHIGDEKYNELRGASGRFLQGFINSLQFYELFTGMVGEKFSKELFPQMVSLLPDPDKRDQLMRVYSHVTPTMLMQWARARANSQASSSSSSSSSTATSSSSESETGTSVPASSSSSASSVSSSSEVSSVASATDAANALPARYTPPLSSTTNAPAAPSRSAPAPYNPISASSSSSSSSSIPSSAPPGFSRATNAPNQTSNLPAPSVNSVSHPAHTITHTRTPSPTGMPTPAGVDLSRNGGTYAEIMRQTTGQEEPPAAQQGTKKKNKKGQVLLRFG